MFKWLLVSLVIAMTMAAQPTATDLGIFPDESIKATAETCSLCIETFFKLQVTSYPLESYLRQRCPNLRVAGQPLVCNRLAHFLLMNSKNIPAAKSCTYIKYCTKPVLTAMVADGSMAKLEALVGYGNEAVGRTGVWGKYKISAEGDDGNVNRCLEECRVVALRARMEYNGKGLHGLSQLQDSYCPTFNSLGRRHMCALVMDYVRLNGAQDDPIDMCRGIHVCEFTTKGKIRSVSEPTVTRD